MAPTGLHIQTYAHAAVEPTLAVLIDEERFALLEREAPSAAARRSRVSCGRPSTAPREYPMPVEDWEEMKPRLRDSFLGDRS